MHSPQRSHVRGALRVSPKLFLSLFYLALVLLRFAGACLLEYSLYVMPDETLYLELSRSLWTQGEILYRGQPIDYNYILYPLLLAPLNGLPQSMDPYRAMQLLNALLMNLAVFPTYLLAKRVCASERSALTVAGLSLLVPELWMTKFLVTENLLYPLVPLAFYTALRGSRPGRVQLGWTALTALLCVLMYFTKPGYLAIGAAWATVLLLAALKTRDRGSVQSLLTGLGCLGLFYLLARGLVSLAQTVPATTETGVYAGQLYGLTRVDWSALGAGIVMHAFFFLGAYLLLPVVVPAALGAPWSGESGFVRSLALLSVLLMTVGTAYAVYMPESSEGLWQSRVHLRYLFCLFPPLLALLLAPNPRNKRGNWKLVLLTVLAMGVGLFLPPDALSQTTSQIFSSMTLTFFLRAEWIVQSQALFRILLPIFAAAFVGLLLWKGLSRTFLKGFLTLLTAMLLLCNATFYLHNRKTGARTTLRQEAMEVLARAGDAPTLAVASGNMGTGTRAMMLELCARQILPICDVGGTPWILLDQDGAALPFVPGRAWKEEPSRPIEARYLILDQSVLGLVQLAPELHVVESSHGSYLLLEAPVNAPWIQARLERTFGNYLIAGSSIMVFDEAILGGGEINLELTLGTGMEEGFSLELACLDQSIRFDHLVTGETLRMKFACRADSGPVQIELNALGMFPIVSWNVSGANP